MAGLISIFFASLLFFMVLALVVGAPLVFSKNKTAQAMIELLDVKPGELVYDLGSGDGRLLILAAKKRAKIIGIEINPYVAIFSWIKVVLSGVGRNVQIIWGNFWSCDLSKADKVIVYGVPWIMEKIGKKLQTELKPGTKVVSNSFQIPNLTLVKTAQIGNDKIYLYVI